MFVKISLILFSYNVFKGLCSRVTNHAEFYNCFQGIILQIALFYNFRSCNKRHLFLLQFQYFMFPNGQSYSDQLKTSLNLTVRLALATISCLVSWSLWQPIRSVLTFKLTFKKPFVTKHRRKLFQLHATSCKFINACYPLSKQRCWAWWFNQGW